MRRKYDESLAIFEDAHEDGTLKLEQIDFGRRAAVEKELRVSYFLTRLFYIQKHFLN